MPKLSFCRGLNEALHEEMERDPSVFIYGIGVPDHKKIFGSVEGLLERFGSERCFDTPLAEDAMTGFGLGAAINGLRPIHVHIRVDFLLLAMNQLLNMVSTASYGSGGKLKAPIVIRAVIGRGWGQGYQHSKSLHSYFAHIPGLKVVAPTTPADAKGLLKSAIRDDNPVVFLEHRWLYWAEDEVPEGDILIPIGKPNILREGLDLTVIATSWMNVEAMRAAKILQAQHGISIEIVDPRTLSPSSEVMQCFVDSARKTKNVIIADNDWVYSGLGAEYASSVYEATMFDLQQPIQRLGFSHTPCPTVRCLENDFYPNAETIVRKVEEMLSLEPCQIDRTELYSHERRFKGPF